MLFPQPVLQFSTQLDAMQHLKEQLEQRTRMIEANIQRQQEELRQIQEELQRVQGQGLQVRRVSASQQTETCHFTYPQLKLLDYGKNQDYFDQYSTTIISLLLIMDTLYVLNINKETYTWNWTSNKIKRTRTLNDDR